MRTHRLVFFYMRLHYLFACLIAPLFSYAQTILVYAENPMYYEVFVNNESILQNNGKFTFSLSDAVPSFEVYIPKTKQRLKKVPRVTDGYNVYAIYQNSDQTFSLGFRGYYSSKEELPQILTTEINQSKTFLTKPKQKVRIKDVLKELNAEKSPSIASDSTTKTIENPKPSQPQLSFDHGIEILNTQSSDVRRLILMKEWFRYPEYIEFPAPNQHQIRRMAQTLSNDGATLDLLIFLFKFTGEKEGYEDLKEVLQFSMSQSLLIDRLQSIRQRELKSDSTLISPISKDTIHEEAPTVP